MHILDTIKTRRSIRKYKDKPVEKKKLFNVLEAARLAPSAMNKQPYRLVVVTEREIVRKLISTCNQDWTTPMIIVVCAFPSEAWTREDGEQYWKVDAAIAMHNISMVAVEEGLGTCWIAAFKEYEVKRILGIPPQARVMAMTPLGYPDEKKGPVTRRKSLKELVRYEKW
ncbi:MAG: nitroreductase family protein [Candidatus Bathyarchaeota archaeon]|nr:MAG: nitroreductase family protein [Candidatus Bathyarchaeota archaeon]